jgi:hypothetical protein
VQGRRFQVCAYLFALDSLLLGSLWYYATAVACFHFILISSTLKSERIRCMRLGMGRVHFKIINTKHRRTILVLVFCTFIHIFSSYMFVTSSMNISSLCPLKRRQAIVVCVYACLSCRFLKECPVFQLV